MAAQKSMKPAAQRSLRTLSAVVTAGFVLFILYWMRSVIIPVALAVFLAYVLTPLVSFAQRRGLGRMPSVILSVCLALVVLVGTATAFVTQLSGLSDTVVENKDQIKKKLADIRTATVGDGESRWARMADELEQTLTASPPPGTTQTVIVEPSFSWMSRFETVGGSAVGVLGQGLFALILVVFILLAKEDLQDRVLRVFGDGVVTSATRATGDATRRVSRYLFVQLLLNSAFGLVLMIGLAVLGVKYAILWGLLAAVMRYVPYIGAWIGVLPAILFSFALSDGWAQPIGVVILFAVVELVTNNWIEPKLYGSRLGVSEVALLVSAAFWSFMWGPIGLILSGPITTCLVAFGKHIPPFRFLSILLGTDPPLTPGVALYQRLMARNQDEAVRVVEAAIPEDEPKAVFDVTVVPALTLVKQAKFDGNYDADDEREVLTIAGEVIDEVALQLKARSGVDGDGNLNRIRVLACPASDEADRLSLEALADLLPENRWEVKVTTVATLTSEVLGVAEQFQPDVICIGALPPNGVAHVRYLCKRLRAKFPDVHILVGRWGDTNTEALADQFSEAGATAVENSLLSTRTRLIGWMPVFSQAKENTPTVAKQMPADDKPAAIGTLRA